MSKSKKFIKLRIKKNFDERVNFIIRYDKKFKIQNEIV